MAGESMFCRVCLNEMKNFQNVNNARAEGGAV